MATKKETQAQAVKYMGHLYVLAGDEEPMDEALLDEMAEDMVDDDAPAPAPEEDEEMEEVELVDALKQSWQVVLDRLPDDLDVDEEFEEALNSIEEVIKVMEEMHADVEGEEELPEGEELPPEDLPEDELDALPKEE